MPYDIIKRDSKYCVVKVVGDSTKTIKCHLDRDDATNHLAALSVNKDFNMTIPTKEDIQEQLSELDSMIANQKFYTGPMNFDEYDAYEQAQKVSSDVWRLFHAFGNMFSDWMYYGGENRDKIDGVIGLVDGLKDRIEKVSTELQSVKKNLDHTKIPEKEPAPIGYDVLTDFLASLVTNKNKYNLPDDSIKVSEELTLFKGLDGKQYLYGRPTNNIYDREGEVLTEESHKEFMSFLDDNPDESPLLMSWHVKGTERESKAIWWDYSDGFVHMLWPLTGEEAEGIKTVSKSYVPGMSHGFKVLKRDGDAYLKYRTVEASILPLEEAANIYTTFEILSSEEGKMFTPEKKDFLAKIGGEDRANELEALSEKTKESLDSSGVVRKNKETPVTEEPKKEDPEPEEDLEPDLEPVVEPVKSLETKFTTMEAVITKGFGDVLAVVQTLDARLSVVEEKVNQSEETDPEEPTPTHNGKSLANTLDQITLFSGSVLSNPNGTTKSTEDVPEAIAKTLTEPKETEAKDDVSQHALGGILSRVKA